MGWNTSTNGRFQIATCWFMTSNRSLRRHDSAQILRWRVIYIRVAMLSSFATYDHQLKYGSLFILSFWDCTAWPMSQFGEKSKRKIEVKFIFRLDTLKMKVLREGAGHAEGVVYTWHWLCGGRKCVTCSQHSIEIWICLYSTLWPLLGWRVRSCNQGKEKNHIA